MRRVTWFAFLLVGLVVLGFAPGTFADSCAESGNTGATTATAQGCTTSGGLNTLTGTFSTGDDIDFFKVSLLGGLTTFSLSPTGGGVGFIPVIALFKPDGTLYMLSGVCATTMTANISSAGDWYFGMSIYRDFPTRYFPSQISAGGNGGNCNGDGGALLLGEAADYKPYSPAIGDSSYYTPNLPPDTSGFSYSVTFTQPVPEPSTLLLLGTGLAGLWLKRRK